MSALTGPSSAAGLILQLALICCIVYCQLYPVTTPGSVMPIWGEWMVQPLLKVCHPPPAAFSIGQAACQEHIIRLVGDCHVIIGYLVRICWQPKQSCWQSSSQGVQPLNVCGPLQHACTQQESSSVMLVLILAQLHTLLLPNAPQGLHIEPTAALRELTLLRVTT